jgi:hypothetical protein
LDVVSRKEAYQDACRQFDLKNDAEIVNEIQRQTGRKLKSLDPDEFNKKRLVISIRSETPEAHEGHGFKAGDKVKAAGRGLVNRLLSGDRITGRVQGIKGDLVRVNGQYYSPDSWVKA